MRRHAISKYFITSVVAVLMVLCLSWQSRDGLAQPNDATGDDVLTVEQCINSNTDASIKPVEKTVLIKEGIIEEHLSNRKVTREECKEIVARTPNGSPVERLVAAGNVTQEVNAVQNSMNDAVEGDVNGDGVVDVQDARTASAASYAASQTAQRTVRTATNEEMGRQIGVIKEINAVPVAYLQSAAQQQYDDGGGGDGGGDDGGGDGGDDLFDRLPPLEKVQDQAVSAAQDRGASPEAAVAGGNCAARVALADGTYLDIFRGHMVFETPAKEMVWQARDVTELVMSPSARNSIEDLKQELEEAQQSDEIQGRCIGLASKMQAKLISSDAAFAITPLVPTEVQDIAVSESTGWKWEIVASNEGTHRLALYIEMQSEQGEVRAVQPLPFDDDVVVRATLWQKSARFVGGNWQFFLAPFLAPIAFYLWRRYRQPPNEHDEGNV